MHGVEERAFYAAHSPLSDPQEHVDLYADLPADPAELARVVQGLIFHQLSGGLYGVQLSSQQHDETYLRTVAQILARIRKYDPASLTKTREAKERLVGNCRDFALLFTSMLRHQGVAARVRVGFATYLHGRENFKQAHWITEYWDPGQERWLLADAELDEVKREANLIDFDTLDMRFGRHFYSAGQAWLLCRQDKMASHLFGHTRRLNGLPFIRGHVLFELAALNKRELLVWDNWGELGRKRFSSLTAAELDHIDQLAEITANTQYPLLCEVYQELPDSRIIDDRLRLLGHMGPVTLADPHQLSGQVTPLASRQGNMLNKIENKNASLPQQKQNGASLRPDNGLVAPQNGHGELGDIIVRGARQHNLKEIDVLFPRNRFIVVTGVSGSGKSSLAMDTLYAEGQRRYVESLSSYARQFVGQMEKPKVDQISGLSPAIAIGQKTVSRNPRSTVATVTEVMDYLRVLYARLGTPHCPSCGRPVVPQSPLQIANQLLDLEPGTRFQLLAPAVRGRKGTQRNLLGQARRDGYRHVRIDGQMQTLDGTLPQLAKNKKHNIELIVDRLIVPEAADEEFRQRLIDSVETALNAGQGLLVVDLGDDEVLFSEHNACPHCDISFQELSPNLFSFNSPFGMCPDCNGLGQQLQVDVDLIVTKPKLSLLDGASPYYGELRKKGSTWMSGSIKSIAEHYGADLEQPWQDLPERFRQVLIYGSDGEKLLFKYENERSEFSGQMRREVEGAKRQIDRYFRQTRSEYRRRFLSSFMNRQPCPTCQGERLCPEARYVTVGGQRLPEILDMNIHQASAWANGLRFPEEKQEVAVELVKEVADRLQFMLNVGLHYLTLNRPAPTLSGGESQRIRLASQLGCGLVGVVYILDEPSIGLHARDHHALLQTLLQLRDMGNTVVVIEHDGSTMRAADWLIDLGPDAGVLGGELVAAGTPQQVMADSRSLTGLYLSGARRVTRPQEDRREPSGRLSIHGARLHNLKGIDVDFPLGVFTCVTGVSGSGKSSLVRQTLYPALARALHNAQSVPGPHEGIEGLDQVNKVINITQDPIGRTPRSNPATYVGVFSEIRKLFASLPEAKTRGYQAGRFSFNVKGGRCETCKGHGRKRVEMHFLADVWVTCAACGGSRYNRPTLEVTYHGRSIADVLDMEVQEALEFFAPIPKIAKILQTLDDVGLEYIKLGQSALTLSGGEAQRVKLAKELSRSATGRTVYILDEPTTGLHFADIQQLLNVLHRLVDAGNSVIVIEHNMEVIDAADYIIDLGPEGGDAGGYVVTQGTPEAVSKIAESHTGRYLVKHHSPK